LQTMGGGKFFRRSVRDLATQLLDKHSLRAADSLQLAAALSGANGVRPEELHLRDQPIGQAAESAGFSVLEFEELFPERNITPCPLAVPVRLFGRRWLFQAVVRDASMTTSSCALHPAIQSAFPILSPDRHAVKYRHALERTCISRRGTTTPTLIRASRWFKSTGPPSKSPVNTRLFSLSLLGNTSQKPICQLFANLRLA